MAAASATIAIAIDAMLPAFGDVREHFGLPSTSSSVALIITVFMVGIGVGQVLYGPLADRFGRKPVFMAGLLLYAVACFATALAPSLTALLIGRFFWGLGAAGPRVVVQALLRDRFRGDLLARSMAIILTVFLIVPTLAPALGQAVLAVGSWRYTFLIGPIFATLVAAWSTRLNESLDPSMRVSLDVRSVGRSVVEVLRTRSALGNTIALMMLSAAFLPYLGSSERMYGEIYDRGAQFFLWFAATAIVMAGFTLATTWTVKRVGARRSTMGALALLVGVSAVFAIVAIAADGAPPFAFFVVATTIAVSLNVALTPLLTSRALDEVGHIAGTAASTIGAISLIGAALLSPLVDNAIETTITPFAVGYLAFSVAAALAATWADRSKRKPETARSPDMADRGPRPSSA